MALSAEIAKARASVARRTQSYPDDHPRVIDARRALRALHAEEYIARLLAEAPPLTDEQLTRLAELLKPVRRTAGV